MGGEFTYAEIPTEQEIAVEAIFENFLGLRERTQYNGDYSAVDTLKDLSTAIRLADLTERQRKTLHLHYVYGYKQSEIGRKLGTSQQTISTHHRAAIKKIAKIYEQWEELA